MSAGRTVKVIPPIINQVSIGNLAVLPVRKKVAAYARVSTDSAEQLTSYEAQVDFYTRHICSNPEWAFVEVYTDEGISATNTKRREGFKRMVKDALDGRIDLILTKSISRFARNTVDTLTTVRQLKEKGIEVYFEKENIYTMDSKGELLITIMSSLAQEESRSISENVKWGKRKSFADGKVSLPYKQFLGYEKGEDGSPKIVPEQAELVRRIYTMFLEGRTPSGIATLLTEANIPTPGGKERWQSSTVESILTNEKYRGDAILQKCFTVDFLTKRQKANVGEVPQYYVEGSHDAIIAPAIHEMVQDELKRRKNLDHRYSAAGMFSGKLICGECGSAYGPKVWHSTSKYRRVIWRCNSKYKNDNPCAVPHFYQEEIMDAFVKAFNRYIQNRVFIAESIEKATAVLADSADLDDEKKKHTAKCDAVAEAIKACISENTTKVLDQKAYERRYNALVKQYEGAVKRIEELDAERERRDAKRRYITRCLDFLRQTDITLTVFDEKMWNLMLSSATVQSRDHIAFLFADGTEIVVNADE
jgi:DNA invertase Pin-like site-specific DNA recombinase